MSSFLSSRRIVSTKKEKQGAASQFRGTPACSPPQGGTFLSKLGSADPERGWKQRLFVSAAFCHFSPKAFARLALLQLLSGFTLSCKSFYISVTIIFVLTFLHKNHQLSSRVSKVVSSDFISHFKLVKSRLRPGRFLYGKLRLEAPSSTCSVFEAYTYK